MTRYLSALASIMAGLLSLYFGPNCQAAIVEGVVLSSSGSVPGATISAYHDYQSLMNRQPAFQSSPGEKEGQYRLELPEGQYYFVAEKDATSGGFFSYHGLNPISVTSSNQWIPFFAVQKKPKQCTDGFQGIGGHVLFRGRPVANGGISVYSVNDEPFRGMGLLTNTITADGAYWFDLEPGTYVIVARQRQEETGIGPIQKGDLYCYSSENPITIQGGQECEVDLHCYPRNDITHFLAPSSTDPRGKKEPARRGASLEDVPALQAESLPQALPRQPASISGRVTDIRGIPVEGIVVTAYPAEDLDLFQMYIVRFKTPFMATTNKEGNYSLSLENGSYYLVAREKVGEAPVPLEHYGLYEGTANHNIVVRPNETRNDANIIVGRIMP